MPQLPTGGPTGKLFRRTPLLDGTVKTYFGPGQQEMMQRKESSYYQEYKNPDDWLRQGTPLRRPQVVYIVLHPNQLIDRDFTVDVANIPLYFHTHWIQYSAPLATDDPIQLAVYANTGYPCYAQYTLAEKVYSDGQTTYDRRDFSHNVQTTYNIYGYYTTVDYFPYVYSLKDTIDKTKFWDHIDGKIKKADIDPGDYKRLQSQAQQLKAKIEGGRPNKTWVEILDISDDKAGDYGQTVPNYVLPHNTKYPPWFLLPGDYSEPFVPCDFYMIYLGSYGYENMGGYAQDFHDIKKRFGILESDVYWLDCGKYSNSPKVPLRDPKKFKTDMKTTDYQQPRWQGIGYGPDDDTYLVYDKAIADSNRDYQHEVDQKNQDIRTLDGATNDRRSYLERAVASVGSDSIRFSGTSAEVDYTSMLHNIARVFNFDPATLRDLPKPGASIPEAE